MSNLKEIMFIVSIAEKYDENLHWKVVKIRNFILFSLYYFVFVIDIRLNVQFIQNPPKWNQHNFKNKWKVIWKLIKFKVLYMYCIVIFVCIWFFF